MLNISHELDLQDCPICGGPALLEEEKDASFYVMCMDCGAHTADVSYRTADERPDCAQRAARLWNIGKVLPSTPGD